MKLLLNCFLLTLFLSLSGMDGALAQTYSSALDQAATANGKMGVVVMVLATIFVGIIIFLIVLERRMRRLEQQK